MSATQEEDMDKAGNCPTHTTGKMAAGPGAKTDSQLGLVLLAGLSLILGYMVKMIKEGKFIKLSDLLSKALHNHMGESGLTIVSKKGIPQNYPLFMHETAE